MLPLCIVPNPKAKALCHKVKTDRAGSARSFACRILIRRPSGCDREIQIRSMASRGAPSAPMMLQLVQTMRGPNVGTGTSSGHDQLQSPLRFAPISR